jgi:hypothetical protein
MEKEIRSYKKQYEIFHNPIIKEPTIKTPNWIIDILILKGTQKQPQQERSDRE